MKAQFFGIFNCFLQMLVPVNQQISGNFFIFGTQVKLEKKSLCIPVGASAIFFPCKSFRADIKPFIPAGIRLVQLKNIEPDSLLGQRISFNDNIAV